MEEPGSGCIMEEKQFLSILFVFLGVAADTNTGNKGGREGEDVNGFPFPGPQGAVQVRQEFVSSWSDVVDSTQRHRTWHTGQG